MAELNERLLGDLLRIKAEQQPDFDVLTFEHLSLDGGKTPDEVRTYRDLATNANQIAAALISQGLDKGGRFGLMMRNHPEYVESMGAASMTGSVFVPIDPRTQGEKLAYFLQNSECKGLICADYCMQAVHEIRADVPTLEWIMVLDTSGEAGEVDSQYLNNTLSLNQILEAEVAPTVSREVELQDPLSIMFTSGTTGNPKGIVIPNERLSGMGMLGFIFGYTETDRPYTGLSLTHGNAMGVTLMPSLGMGLRGVFSRRFTKSKLLDVCRLHGCTTFSLLGGMATAIYSEPERPDDGENSLRLVASAGMPGAIWESFERRFKLKIFEWYGAMEGGMAFKPVGEGPVGSFGQGVPGFEMKILDENDNECAVGEMGEICSRPEAGGSAEVEYYKNPKASEEKTRGGWLRSGDMGYRNEDGWLFFGFRKGGGIRHNGDFVNTSFVEKVIAEHPGVKDVFVYGIEAASGAPGESDVVAALVPSDADSFSKAGIFSACRAGLESNFVPSYLQVVTEIPKTASEKPQTRFLLEQFSNDADNIFTEE
ncbi:MAG: ATP-dependent acyl-CoA ligase [Gammaproteobacteria bacterium]|nr:ATP-dependent acyl-CoA ligase [Gammaproteobacteria bacterium]|tara:strand:+ start:168 stop:1784 length:1617 start_codon:yes stop_codon:yes gene_type:complete